MSDVDALLVGLPRREDIIDHNLKKESELDNALKQAIETYKAGFDTWNNNPNMKEPMEVYRMKGPPAVTMDDTDKYIKKFRPVFDKLGYRIERHQITGPIHFDLTHDLFWSFRIFK